MKPVHEMSAAELVDEAERRKGRREKGLNLALDPVELAKREEEHDRRLEREIQGECRRTYIAYGCKVYVLSQPRRSKQTPGLGDMWVVHRRLRRAWWHETKTDDGRLSNAQLEFAADCMATETGYRTGGVAAAENQLIIIGAAERTATGSIEPRRGR